jgi:hypothetical protein
MTVAMRTLLLPLLALLLAAAGCHFADTPSTRDDAANISNYDPKGLRDASWAAYTAGRK